MTDFDIPLLYLYRYWLMEGSSPRIHDDSMFRLYEKTGNPLYYNMYVHTIVDRLILRFAIIGQIQIPKN